MARTLPQLSGGTFLCDGGLETTLMFHQGVDLPHFAAFVLLDDEQGRKRLRTITSRTWRCAPTPLAPAICSTPRPGAPTPTGPPCWGWMKRGCGRRTFWRREPPVRFAMSGRRA